MENAVEIVPGGADQNPVEEEISFLTYLFRGFIFPCGSLSFYKVAVKKKLLWAITFFICFGLVFSFIQSIVVGNTLKTVGEYIEDGFQNGDIPKLTISNGEMKVYEKEPIVHEMDGVLLAIDSTGQITEIERNRYDTGILLTKTDMHVLNETEYRILSYQEINTMFGDPIYIDEPHVMEFWQSMSTILGISIFLGLWFWSAGIRLLYILVVGLVLWGIVSLSKKGVGFEIILISGIFANVPVMYIKTILSWMNVSFFLLYTLLLFLIWGFVLFKLFKNQPEETDPVVVSDAGQTPLG